MIAIYKPTLRRKDMADVLSVLASEQIGPNARKAEFEEKISKISNYKDARSVRSFSQAFQIAIDFYDLSEGCKVALSPLAPKIYKLYIENYGFEIKLCDIDEESGTLLPDNVKDCSLVIHYIPQQGYFKKELWSDVSIPQIADITNIQGDIEAEKPSPVAIMTFEESAPISCAMGAAVLSDLEWPYELPEDVIMPDLNAALGLSQLDALGEYSKKRFEIVSIFKKALAKTKHKPFGLQTLEARPPQFYFLIVLASKTEEIFKFTKKAGVEVLPAFRDSIGYGDNKLSETCPHATYIINRTIQVPMYYFLKASEIETVSKVISHLP